MARRSIRERNAESIARQADIAPAATETTQPALPAETQPETQPEIQPETQAETSSESAEDVVVDVTGWTPTEHEELDEQESTTAAAKATAAQKTAEEKAAAKKAARKKAAQAKAATEKNLGVYMSADTYTSLKAAYLADWSNGRGEADTLYKWVAAALDTHSSRTPAQRAGLASTGPYRADTQIGQTKAFKVPTATWERMQEAIAADAAENRWLSDSRWASEALLATVEAARKANGGTLPNPPERLPNRLKGRGR